MDEKQIWPALSKFEVTSREIGDHWNLALVAATIMAGYRAHGEYDGPSQDIAHDSVVDARNILKEIDKS